MSTMIPAVIIQVVLVLLAGADAVDVSPLGKVVELLSELQEQVVTEGREEALTYDKFACYCKDMSTHKAEDITEAQDDVDKLIAEIQTLNTERNGFDTELAELTEKIDEIAAKMKATEDKRAQDHHAYQTLKAELENSSENCEMAGDEIKTQLTAGGIGFLSVSQSVKPFREALLRAKALGFRSMLEPKKTKHASSVGKFLDALLQQDPSLSASPSLTTETGEEIEEAGGELIDAIDGIEGDFTGTIDQITRDEFKNLGKHQVEMQRLRNLKDLAEADHKKAQERRAFRVEDIAENTRDLTEIQAVLLDDQKFLSDATGRCNWAAGAWDQRTDMRAGELSALTAALVSVKQRATTGTGSRSSLLGANGGRVAEAPAFLQVAESTVAITGSSNPGKVIYRMKHRLRARRDPTDPGVAERSAEFVEQEEGQEHEREESPQALTLALLKEKGEGLKSQELLGLAAQVVGSPFAKVKQLIQELTERLLQEAADEANHKGWCDKELGRVKQKRDMKVEEIRHRNSRMAAAEVKRDRLQETAARLGKEIEDLTASLDNASKERAEESEENMVAVRGAEDSLEAIKGAEDVLMKFYKTAAKAEIEAPPPEPTNPTPASLLAVKKAKSRLRAPESPKHSSEEKEAPELGFDGAYQGKQDGTPAVIGLLQVIQSDFERLAKGTTASEREAQKAYERFIEDSKSSMAMKNTAKKAHEKEVIMIVSALLEDKTSLVADQAELNEALKEKQQLNPMCVAEVHSYEERVAKREQEVASLKEALCIFDPSLC